MYVGKKQIVAAAQHLNAIEADMEQNRNSPEKTAQSAYYEVLKGAYFSCWKMTELLGVEKEVFEAREQLKEEV